MKNTCGAPVTRWTCRIRAAAAVAGIGIFALAQVGSVLLSDPVHAQAPEFRFAGYSVYGTDLFDAESMAAEFAPVVDELLAMLDEFGPQGAGTQGKPFMDKIHDALAAKGEFAELNVGGLLGSNEPGIIQVTVTVEAVEAADVTRRMPFREPPNGSYEDPDGIFALWSSYFETAMPLMATGELFEYEDDCPVLHCFFPFAVPVLNPFLEAFNAAAAKHEDLLYEIARNDQQGEHRVGALRTLAHTDDVNRLLPLLASSIYDPYGEVRNDAMRIMLYIAQNNPSLEFPVDDLIVAMDFPSVAERNKAVYVLSHLVAIPHHANVVREKGLPDVLRLLRTTVPITHEPAYDTLKTLSGESFGARDYASWESWAQTASSVR